jgi:hypothetical protein
MNSFSTRSVSQAISSGPPFSMEWGANLDIVVGCLQLVGGRSAVAGKGY